MEFIEIGISKNIKQENFILQSFSQATIRNKNGITKVQNAMKCLGDARNKAIMFKVRLFTVKHRNLGFVITLL